MPDSIVPHRLFLDNRFSVMGFTVRTSAPQKWFEVALATDPQLFRPEAKGQRTPANFYSSCAAGPLLAERNEAVYLTPAEALSRFVGQPKLYYALATFPDPNRSQVEIASLPTAGSPWIDLTGFTGLALRRQRSAPARLANGASYNTSDPRSLEWAGDLAQPGMQPVSSAPTNGVAVSPSSPSNGSGAPVTVGIASTPTNTPISQGISVAYDDGYGVWPSDEVQRQDFEDRGIEGPIPDEQALPEQQAYSFPLMAAEYPQANRFVPAAQGNYRALSTPRAIKRIVIHITDGGANINGTINWFKNPEAKVSAHYVVGQDGEVVQMVKHNDIAWHASSANSDSIGIEHVANTRGIMPTEKEYCASATLVQWLCNQYSIPIDRSHILGHAEADPRTSHTGCPNAVWDWQYFMELLANPSEEQINSSQESSSASQSFSAINESSQAFAADIPLTPENGGRSITFDALEMGDIILSTTDEVISDVIRSLTEGPVSHAMLYTGDGAVIEAIGEGVVHRPLNEALAESTLAVAFRFPGLTQDQQWAIREFAGLQVGKPYNKWGIIRQARFQLDRRLCEVYEEPKREQCTTIARVIDLGVADNQTFFCSQLVLAAYEAANVSLTPTPPNWSAPSDIAELRFSNKLCYVGHLRTFKVDTNQSLGLGRARPLGEQVPVDVLPSALKELDYSDALPDELDAERLEPQPTAALTNEEIYRIIREVAVADSDQAVYGALMTDQDYAVAGVAPGRQFGLAFGLTLFTQESGRLGSVLRLMKQRDAAAFADIFGPQAEALLATTNAPTAAERLQPVGGEPLSNPAWIERFKRAAELPACQFAQNEEAIEGQFRPMLQWVHELGLTTDRALAMAYDRVVTQGLGSSLRWIVQTAGPLRTAAQRNHALQLLGFNDLAQFQTSTGQSGLKLPADGRFTYATHAALVGAMRRLGIATLPQPDELAWRLYAAATGPAKRRLRRLLDASSFTDVVYRLS